MANTKGIIRNALWASPFIAFVIVVLGVFVWLDVSGSRLIEEGDSLFTRGRIPDAQRAYLAAENRLGRVPGSLPKRLAILARLAVLARTQGGEPYSSGGPVASALWLTPKFLYADLEAAASRFGVKLTEADILSFRKLEFNSLLPRLLRQDSPLHKSVIVLTSDGQGRVNIDISYNHKDLQTTDPSAKTTYQSTGSLQGDVIRDMAEMVGSIFDFARDRKAIRHMHLVSVSCHHGVRRLAGQEEDMVIYAIRADLGAFPPDAQLAKDQTTSGWSVTLNEFPNLRIGF